MCGKGGVCGLLEAAARVAGPGGVMGGVYFEGMLDEDRGDEDDGNLLGGGRDEIRQKVSGDHARSPGAG